MHIGILGGGLAGTFLAARLLGEGCKVVLIDEPKANSASNVAAGLFNVITGRFGAKTWQAELFNKELFAFFQHPQYAFLNKYLHQVPIYRPFKSTDEYNKWTGRAEDPEYTEWTRFQEQPFMPDSIHNSLGGIWIQKCGWLDTRSFLKEFKSFLIQNLGLELLSERLDYSALQLEEKSIFLAGKLQKFDALVFCEGYQAFQNPFFDHVRLIPNKGELLEIEIPNLSISWVLSRKVYLIPMGSHTYLAGSTYKNSFDSPFPSEEGKEAIEEMLQKAIVDPFFIKSHKAGIRPTTPNRRPILGRNHLYPWMYMFNGLGTKGVLQAPYFSRLMADLILGKNPVIPPEVDVQRF